MPQSAATPRPAKPNANGTSSPDAARSTPRAAPRMPTAPCQRSPHREASGTSVRATTAAAPRPPASHSRRPARRRDIPTTMATRNGTARSFTRTAAPRRAPAAAAAVRGARAGAAAAAASAMRPRLRAGTSALTTAARVDDGRRESHEQGREAPAHRPGDGAHHQGRGEDPSEREREDRSPHGAGVGGTRRGQRPEPDEEERRLGGEHVGAERGAVCEGPGAPEVDALVEFGRVDREVPARREADGQKDQAQGSGLGRPRRGEPGVGAASEPTLPAAGAPGSCGGDRFQLGHIHRDP
jgi:hypothetical protein